jgi:hypothetical protein
MAYLNESIESAGTDDRVVHDAVIKLLVGDIPLDGSDARKFIAGLYYLLAYPHAKRDRIAKRLSDVRVAATMKQIFIDEKKMTPGEAEEEVAKLFHVSPEAIRKRRERNKRQ